MTGSYVAPSLRRITVGELAPIWLSRKESDVPASNYRTLESAWRVHVAHVWRSARIADLDLAAVEQRIAAMKDVRCHDRDSGCSRAFLTTR